MRVVLDSLGQDGPFIVAPAGNQSCIIPQYPAAFQGPDPPERHRCRPSVDAGRGEVGIHELRWVGLVQCGRQGCGLDFLDGYTGETEDSDDPENPVHGTKAFDTGWARWSGTSFAAPKVAGTLARSHANGASLAEAWDDLRATGVAQPGLGVVLPLLSKAASCP